MAVAKLTEAFVKSIPASEDGQKLFYDNVLRGFGLRVSRRSLSFFAERRLSGKTKRRTIGPYPCISVEQARKAAQVILGELTQGIDRKKAARDAQLKAVTLAEAFEEFKRAKKSLSPRTVDDYSTLLNRHASDWMKRPWPSITTNQVLMRHREVGNAIGGPTANYLMRALGSVLRFSMKFYKDTDGKCLVSECPTVILSDTKAWYPERTKDSYLKPNQLSVWWKAVEALENRTAADYFVMLLLTGLRRSECASLRWTQVDLDNRTITIHETKNGRKHVLPIPDYLFDLLSRRKSETVNEHVFPGPGITGHIVEIKNNLAKVRKALKFDISLHDLRRTFVTIAESLDISAFAVKRLVNHSMSRDVTAAHYIVFDIERLREPMEKIGKFILKSAGALPSADVLQLTAKTPMAA